MKFGLVFPQTEYGSDPVAIRDFAQSAEALGYSHIIAYDHVLGANPDRPGGWTGPYTYRHPFHEPFVLFSYMAGVTTTLEFATAILILPQRETALVAKQASTLAILSGNRFRLGVGVGWNAVEYTALNQQFHTRGKRMDEQLSLLRKLWSEDLVTFRGDWHDIPDAGLNPLPARPVPLWFGGHADAVMRRIAEVGDGWFPGFKTASDASGHLETLDRYLTEVGRSRDDVGVEPRLAFGAGDVARWHGTIRGWQDAGADYLSLNTMGCGFDTPSAHLDAITTFAKEVGIP